MVQLMGHHQGLGPFSNQPFKQQNALTPETRPLSPWKNMVETSSAVGSGLAIQNFFNNNA